jgi:glyoxylase-like metal-dependent hydrolase (beta-lactamase superfamily II)
MPRIPIEDTFSDVIAKAQRGLGISDAELCKRAEVAPHDLRSVKSGTPVDAVIRRVARHLALSPDALEELAHNRWYPKVPAFPHGFSAFSTSMDGMLVNSYLVWDARSKAAAAFDTGADCGSMLDLIGAEGLKVRMILVTHNHEDHVADLPRLARETGAEVWSSELEPLGVAGARTFRENVHFHLGPIAIKTLATHGHSPGQTTFYVTGLSYPLAVVGDSLFASSIGGSAEHFRDQLKNDTEKILRLPRDTVLACGHGPLTTVAQEKRHNPFFAS